MPTKQDEQYRLLIEEYGSAPLMPAHDLANLLGDYAEELICEAHLHAKIIKQEQENRQSP